MKNNLFKWLAFIDEPIDAERVKIARGEGLNIYTINKHGRVVVGSACELAGVLGISPEQVREIASQPMTTITTY